MATTLVYYHYFRWMMEPTNTKPISVQCVIQTKFGHRESHGNMNKKCAHKKLHEQWRLASESCI